MNWDILGNEWAVNMLAGQIVGERLNHAYLFTGPNGLGRRTLALRFAQAINCTNPPVQGAACGTCRSCRQIGIQEHPDLLVVEAESVGATMKVDQVREMGRFLSLAPYEARYKVALLLRFEEAQRHAANALLKTLEEPNESVILMLTAESPDQLPETILSRCQLIRLRPQSIHAFSGQLQRSWQIPEEQARLLAHVSGGRPGIVRRYLEDPEHMANRQAVLDDQMTLLPASRVVRFRFADQVAKDKVVFREILDAWAAFWRDILIVTTGSVTPLTNIDRQSEIESLAGRIGTVSALNMLKSIERTRDRLDRNANPRLAAENLMLVMPRL